VVRLLEPPVHRAHGIEAVLETEGQHALFVRFVRRPASQPDAKPVRGTNRDEVGRDRLGCREQLEAGPGRRGERAADDRSLAASFQGETQAAFG
jgi:hypothetical protein